MKERDNNSWLPAAEGFFCELGRNEILALQGTGANILLFTSLSHSLNKRWRNGTARGS